VRDAVLGALAHDRLPFDCLVRSLRPDQEEGRQPFSNVFFAYHNFPRTSIDVEGLSLRRHRHERAGAKYDVCLLAVEHEEDAQMITLQLWYDQCRYSEGSMRAALDEVLHLVAVLDGHGTDRRLLALEAAEHSDNREDTPW
jgi:non-ribosomal peptide synthetase component F